MKWFTCLSLLLLLGCTTPAAAPTATALPPAATVAPSEVTAEATAPADQTTDWANTANREGDYFVLGNPDAAILVIDYSDFL